MSKLIIIIPAYNEAKTIGMVLDDLPKKLDKINQIETVVVNDGSSDDTENVAKKRKVKVLTHILNRGLGGALATGIEYAKKNDADIVVTFDADGQHDPTDIPKIIEPILNKKADFVIGSRMKGQGMPLDRKILNWFGNLLTFLLFGLYTTDAQSGMRALSKKAVSLIRLQMNRMEVSSEFIKEIARLKLKLHEVPIKAIYTEYSKVKGQKNTNSVNVFVKLLFYKFVNLK